MELRQEHLLDRKCNHLCSLFEENKEVSNGVIVHSDFRLNKAFDQLNTLSERQKDKVEFLLYYMTKPEYQLSVREEIYLDNMLNLF